VRLKTLIAIGVGVFCAASQAGEFRFAACDGCGDSLVQWEIKHGGEVVSTNTTGTLLSWTLEPATERAEVRYRRCTGTDECGEWSRWGRFVWRGGADLNLDGVVGLPDFALLIQSFGDTVEPVLCKVPSD